MLPYFSSVFRYNIILWLCYLTDYGRRVRIFAPIEHTKVAYPQYYLYRVQRDPTKFSCTKLHDIVLDLARLY